MKDNERQRKTMKENDDRDRERDKEIDRISRVRD